MEHHQRAQSLGFDDELCAEVDRKGLDWDNIFDAIQRYGPMALEILKRILGRRGPVPEPVKE